MAAIIFDFDGTIADDRDYIINFMVRGARRAPLTSEQRLALYGLSLISMARRLGYSWWKLPNLYLKGRTSMNRAAGRMETFSGISSVIKKLHAEGHQLFIVSSNSVSNIRRFLKKHKLRQYFVQVYGGIEVFGKAPVYRQLLKDHSLEPNQTYCIGDEVRDIEAAKTVGIKSIAVTWGFASEADLINIRPAGLARQP